MKNLNVPFKLYVNKEVITGRASAWNYNPVDASQDGIVVVLSATIEQKIKNKLRKDFDFKKLILFAEPNKEIPTVDLNRRAYWFEKV